MSSLRLIAFLPGTLRTQRGLIEPVFKATRIKRAFLAKRSDR